MFRDIKRRQKTHLRVGRSKDEDQDDTNQYRCKVCGFVCDSDRVQVAGPRPNADDELSGNTIETDADGDKYAVVQSGSCPLCGTKYSR